jgi:hypothetical protein
LMGVGGDKDSSPLRHRNQAAGKPAKPILAIRQSIAFIRAPARPGKHAALDFTLHFINGLHVQLSTAIIWV